jgi:hypothetical protein
MRIKAGYTCAEAPSIGTRRRTFDGLSVCGGSVRSVFSQIGSAHVCRGFGTCAIATVPAGCALLGAPRQWETQGTKAAKMPFLIWESVERRTCFLVTTGRNPRQRNSGRNQRFRVLILGHAYFADSVSRIHLVTLRAVFFLITSRIVESLYDFVEGNRTI